MPQQIKKIVDNLQNAINTLESEIDDNLLKAEKGIKITKQAIRQLKAVVINKNS